uniref:Uncharacterized protein n=1 Tax=Rhizophora mucronata TaxID=61149 RepID=A0A2P2NXN6_RHIMU
MKAKEESCSSDNLVDEPKTIHLPPVTEELQENYNL